MAQDRHHKKVRHRANRLAGQMRSLPKLMAENRDANIIYNLFLAIDSGVKKFYHTAVREHFAQQLSAELSARIKACSGDAQQLQQWRYLQQHLDALTDEELRKALKDWKVS